MSHSSKDSLIKVIESAIENIKKSRKKIFIPDWKSVVLSGIHNRLCHSYHELFFHVEGTNVLDFGKVKHIMKPGDITLMPSGTLHHETNPGPDTMWHVVLMLFQDCFEIHWGKALPGEIPEIIFSVSFEHPRGSGLEQLFDLYLNAVAEKHEPIFLQGLELAIVGKILHYLKNEQVYIDKTPDRINRVKLIIEERLSDPTLNVAALAKMTGYNPDYLSHSFKQSTSVSLNNYLTTKRFEAATKFLSNTTMSVSEVAWNCGYNSPSYFISRFKKVYNQSPGEYRNAMRSRKK